MNEIDDLALTLERLPQPATSRPAAPIPSLSNVLRTLSPIPREALFLGVANDRLPVLLNLKDPVPGPVLIIGDPGAGKTRLLQVIAQFTEQAREPENIRYAVMTDRTGEWEGRDQAACCEGIFAFRQAATSIYLNSLVDWAHSTKQPSGFILLLVDGLEDLAGDDNDSLQAFRWLLLRGPSWHIWPIVTLSAAHADGVEPWLAAFRTRLFGRMHGQPGARTATLLTDGAKFRFDTLLAPSQFAMRAGADWLPFWLPSLD